MSGWRPDLYPGARQVNERVRDAVQAEITRRERAQEQRKGIVSDGISMPGSKRKRRPRRRHGTRD